jgi:hypothetical protein
VVGAALRLSAGVGSLRAMSSTLTPGSAARVYRNGELVGPTFNVPIDGRVEIRGLDPGQYELRDECGGQVFIEVTHLTEVVRVGRRGRKDAGPVTAADSTQQLDRPEDPAPPEPIYPPGQDPADIDEDEVDPEWRATLPASEGVAQAGSATEQPSPAVVGRFDDMLVPELRDALREQGKKVSGNRDELVARLEGRDGTEDDDGAA